MKRQKLTGVTGPTLHLGKETKEAKDVLNYWKRVDKAFDRYFQIDNMTYCVINWVCKLATLYGT